MSSRTTTVIQGFDPDELLGVVDGGTTEHYLPDPTVCHGVIQRWFRDDLTVDRGVYAFEVGVRGTFRPDSICIGRVDCDGVRTEINGSPISSTQLQLYREGAEFFYHADPGARWTVIQVRREDLQAAAVALLGRPLDLQLHAVSSWRLGGEETARLSSAVEHVLSPNEFESAGPDDGDAFSDVVLDGIVEAIALGETDDSFREHQIRAHRRLETVRAAQDYLKARPEAAYDSAALCAFLGLPERTIQVAFRRTIGLSPKSWFTSMRLHRVHRVLRGASPATASVTGIARSLGFSHLGRFASDYAGLFGELPSETLAACPSSGISRGRRRTASSR